MTYSEIVIAEIQNGNLEEAMENLELALESDDSETLYLLGNTLFQLGFLNETKRVYNHLVDIHPNDDELKIYLAEIEIEDGNELDALNLLHSIDETSEAYVQSLLVQADYYHLNELPEVSIQKLKEAESLMPNEPVITFALAEVYYTIADYQNAIQHYEQIVEQGVEEVSGTLISARLGSCYVMVGEYENALDQLNDALSYKDDPEVFYQLGLVYVQKEDFSKAIEPLNQAKTLDPSLISIYILLAEVYEQQGELELALTEIEEGLTFNEIHIDFYFKAAELSTKLNEYEKATEYYKEALKIEPENDRSYIKYAEFLSYTEDYEELVELFNKAPEPVQQSPESLWLLAVALNEVEAYDEARSYFEQAALYFNEDLNFLKDYAFFLREDGQRDKMREVVEQYLKQAPEPDAEMYTLLDDYNV